MSHDPSAPPNVAPDRVFLRSAGLFAAGALALTVAGALALEAVATHAARRAELALVAAGQVALVRQIADGLDRLADAPAGPELRVAEVALGWDIERLDALEARRAELANAPEAAVAGMADKTAELAARLAEGIDRDAALAMAQGFATSLAPRAERMALLRESDAARARARAQVVRMGVSGLQLVALAALAAGLLMPARARIAAWVRASSETEQENRFRLLHDPMTQLPNATYLHAHLARLAAGADRTSRQTAVLRLDLDRFKVLREMLGPRVADEIIRITARRIRKVLRAGDFAAHLGHDDFVLVATDIEDAAAAARIAHRVHDALTKPFSLQGGARRIGCSIGVTLLSDDQPDAERALANAEIALAEAQDSGASTIRYFRESLRAEVERREALFAELMSGLGRGELGPHFQAQVNLETGALSGFEALVRWRHPRRGLLAPPEFLDFAEAADLTERIGEVVLAQTLAALTAWDSAGLHVPRVGINFAMAQLRDPRLIEKIKWEVERHDVDPSRIAIEVLETVLIKSDEDMMVRNLRGLASAGFQIELDDFGTGHASIQNLRRLMVHRIKIDRSFVAGIEASAEQRTLTASMIAMARALGIRTLAEGVETPEAAAALRALGCDDVQGFVVSRPMSHAESFNWLAEFTAHKGGPERLTGGVRSDPNKP